MEALVKAKGNKKMKKQVNVFLFFCMAALAVICIQATNHISKKKEQKLLLLIRETLINTVQALPLEKGEKLIIHVSNDIDPENPETIKSTCITTIDPYKIENEARLNSLRKSFVNDLQCLYFKYIEIMEIYACNDFNTKNPHTVQSICTVTIDLRQVPNN